MSHSIDKTAGRSFLAVMQEVEAVHCVFRAGHWGLGAREEAKAHRTHWYLVCLHRCSWQLPPELRGVFIVQASRLSTCEAVVSLSYAVNTTAQAGLQNSHIHTFSTTSGSPSLRARRLAHDVVGQAQGGPRTSVAGGRR
jgi:hypothetical protein